MYVSIVSRFCRCSTVQAENYRHRNISSMAIHIYIYTYMHIYIYIYVIIRVMFCHGVAAVVIEAAISIRTIHIGCSSLIYYELLRLMVVSLFNGSGPETKP